ncbi:MAG TPA: hypothetical protein PKA28_08170 [Methylomusa anaerophila]|uniref:Copper amine oxidase-like N-terminal domain-containing protein n=1 Tax=Methylomusa anaerophila TaxID=1930071 RepID=A0A348ALB2_9FIRM|nr:hypothetical protein [Methylomusa anaerophila]BBB91860.1 hypothetical protein MAMMFC1_02545 [Methylomusa anaerophila]HML88409.1 hypothetical protein [Methylomusa anaerophila]
MKYVTKLVLSVMVIVGLGSQASAAALGPIGLDINSLREWEVKNSSLGGKLLLSDSPEMVADDGILYQDMVQGDVRLFFYHVNASRDVKKMGVILENKGHEVAHITVSRSSLGGPGYGWMTVGKETLTSYLAGSPAYQIDVPPGGMVPLSASISENAILPHMLIHGIYDFTADRPITVKVLMLPVTEDCVKFSRTAKVLSSDRWHLRGTFEGANRQLSPVSVYDPAWDGAVALTLADNEVDVYLKGIDATDGTEVVNYGNYGVVYQILLPSKSGGRIAYYLAPRGGDYAGAIGINHPEVNWSPRATPLDRIYFGNNKQKDFAFLGTYDSGDPLSFTFSPPGASNLPVKLIILPQ